MVRIGMGLQSHDITGYVLFLMELSALEIGIERIRQLQQHPMRLGRARHPRERAEFAARHAGHAAVQLGIATAGGEVGDAAPVRPQRTATQLGRRRMLGIGEGRRQHRAQAGQAKPGGQQVVAVAMLGHALLVEHGRFPGGGRQARAGGQEGDGGDAGAKTESVHAPTIAAAHCRRIVPSYQCMARGIRAIPTPSLLAYAGPDATQHGSLMSDNFLQGRTALEWESVFGDEVPCAAVRTVEDMFDHPQVQAQGLIATYAHPVLGRYRGFTGAVAFARTPVLGGRASPALGEHDGEVRGLSVGANDGD